MKLKNSEDLKIKNCYVCSYVLLIIDGTTAYAVVVLIVIAIVVGVVVILN